MKSEEYYNQNADEFYSSTYKVDLSDIYEKFERYLTANIHILDAGCGSGRDSKYFLSNNYKVSAMDASEEMVIKAKELTGLDVKKMYFQDVTEKEHYDAIWTCASLLHIPKNNIEEVLKILYDALKNSGIWYMSFKHGSKEREKDNRLFNDYTEDLLRGLISKYTHLSILELWITDDRREDRDDKWINIIVKKIL
ncbi:class I SAM-dependent methyltransferase [Sulfurimonas sp. SAG-AH-194-L11]|nr:class I SAM-dependent methyltransferase [Sulfurimonas sp. SAG-AH-194-L11]MDF1876999.1 class I SAM-dependent methyltransferase [Sulfurimonas sp. SAG-AH-194-L11]